MSSSKSRNISRKSSSSVAVEVVIQIWQATAGRRTPIPFIIHTQDKLKDDENKDDCKRLDGTLQFQLQDSFHPLFSIFFMSSSLE